MKLQGKSALVTGGGHGIGRGICLALAREGADVAVMDLNPETAQKVAQEVQGLGRRSLALKADVTQRPEVNRAVETVLSQWGKIDILVNNAGGTPPSLPNTFQELNESQWDGVIAVNLKGAWNCTHAVLGQMIKRRDGRIVNITSIHGVTAVPRPPSAPFTLVPYSTAKHAIVGLTKSLARELGPQGIRVMSVAPGTIQTGVVSPEMEVAMAKLHVLGRLGQPEDIANMVVYLVSDDASFITGQNFVVDGGRVF